MLTKTIQVSYGTPTDATSVHQSTRDRRHCLFHQRQTDPTKATQSIRMHLSSALLAATVTLVAGAAAVEIRDFAPLEARQSPAQLECHSDCGKTSPPPSLAHHSVPMSLTRILTVRQHDPGCRPARPLYQHDVDGPAARLPRLRPDLQHLAHLRRKCDSGCDGMWSFCRALRFRRRERRRAEHVWRPCGANGQR